MTLTPIQEAMCAVIAESGGFPVTGISTSDRITREALSRCCKKCSFNYRIFNRGGMEYFGCTIQSVTVDSHTLTLEEYNQWVEQQNSKN